MNRLLLLFICCFPVSIFSQKQASVWYFGVDTCLRPPTSCQPSVYSYAGGLDFTAGAPVPTSTCSIMPDDGNAVVESVSTMSDKNTGALLFYTEGLNIWDKNHTLMPNGSGLIGSTGVSSTQGALIIPQPGSDSLYYVFTTGSHVDGFASGLRYSVVDISLNGGLGDVIPGQKNIVLASSVTEKLSAALHCNGSDYWIIVHNLGSDAYLSFLLTSTGINTSPVVSNIGSVITQGAGHSGQMKVSPNSYKLASALYINSTASKVELFDFNPSTGKLCNAIQFTGLSLVYGLSFSPDNSKLYFTEYFLTNNINQVNLQAGGGHPDSIKASKTVIATGVFATSLQLAYDGKIYCSQVSMSNLGVINNPNLTGLAANFTTAGPAFTPGKMCSFGLPNFPDHYFIDTNYIKPIAVANFGFSNVCFGDTAFFYDSSIYYSYCPEYKWIFGDPASGTADTSYLKNPAHYYSTPGTYTVTLTVSDYCDVITIQKAIQVTQLNLLASGSTTICAGDSTTISVSGAVNYTWYPAQGLSATTGSTVILFPTSNSTYTVAGDNGGGCKDTIFVSISVNQLPLVDAGNNDSVCPGQNAILVASGGISYMWNTGVTTNTLIVNPLITTVYTVTVSDGVCSNIDTARVVVYSPPNANAGNDETIAPGSSVTLNGSGGISYFWQPSQGLNCVTCQNPVATPTASTTYVLVVTDENGCTKSDVVIVNVESPCNDIYIPNAFSPNKDGQNDVYYIYGTCIKQFTLSIYNRWGEKIFITNNLSHGWDGFYKGSELNTDVFTFLFTAILNSGEEVVRVGTINLIR